MLELHKLLEGRNDPVHFINAFPSQLLFRVQQVKGVAGNANGLTEYIGYAPADAVLSDAKWQIKKLIYDANGFNTQILFADGSSKFEHVFNSGSSEYASYTYTTT